MFKLSTLAAACLIGASAALVAQAKPAPRPMPTNTPPGFQGPSITCDEVEVAVLLYTVTSRSASGVVGFSTKDDVSLITRNDDGSPISVETPLTFKKCDSKYMDFDQSRVIGRLQSKDGRCVTVDLDTGKVTVTGCSTDDNITQLRQNWEWHTDGSVDFLGYKNGDEDEALKWNFTVDQKNAEGPIVATHDQGTITLGFRHNG